MRTKIILSCILVVTITFLSGIRLGKTIANRKLTEEKMKEVLDMLRILRR